MLGLIFLMLAIMMQIFAFLKIPIVSSLHGYTIGMLIGFFNPLFYFFVIFKTLQLIFGFKLKMPKWIRLTKGRYFLFCLAIIFVATSTSFYQTKTSYQNIGYEYWNAFEYWFDDFVDSSAWAPTNTNGGLIGAFLFSFFAMISSGIGAFVISILALMAVLFWIFGHNLLNLSKKKRQAKRDLIKHRQSHAALATTTMELANPKQKGQSNPNWDININKVQTLKPLRSEAEIQKANNLEIKTKNEATLNVKKAEDDNDNLPFEDPFS